MRSVSGSASERWKAMRFKTRYLVGAMAMMLPATAMAQSEMAQNQGFYVQGGLGAAWGMDADLSAPAGSDRVEFDNPVRKRVGVGKSVSVREGVGCRRIIKKKKQ